MKRRAVCFLLCLSFFLCTVSLKSSAVDEDVLYTADDLIEWGWHYDEDSSSYYPDFYSFNPFVTSVLYASEKNYPEFDIGVISWSTFPSYITDIVYSDLTSLSVSAPDEGVTVKDFKVPFVAVIVGQNSVRLFVGQNVAFGRQNNSYSSINIFASPSTSDIYSNSCLYTAQMGYNGNVYSSGWSKLSPSVFGTRNNLVSFTSTILNTDSAFDVYLYGGNGIHYSVSSSGVSISSRSYPINDDGSQQVIFSFSTSGFFSGNPFHSGGQFTYIYQASFTPKTSEQINQELQQEENKTSKSILERIKELPENIADSFKGLFIPEDGFFDTYQQEFQTYFRERFGILYEIPELVITLLTKFVKFNPKEENYSITFPEVVLPVLQDGEWDEVVFIEAQDFSFDFINEAPFNALYDIYVAFIWLVYIMLLVNLIKNKANGVFKGG